ncbi:MAG TPA: peptidoglycan DD-metalloendopeptidase family protein [Acetobacteraceae bacterium]|jgi:septal ring factor EnvC (AmiA/AmiB activator)
MRRAQRSSVLAALLLLPALLLVPPGAPAAPLHKEAITREQAAQAEKERAVEEAAQQQAAARAAASAAQADALAQQRVEAAAKLRDAETATEASAVRMDALIHAQHDAATQLAARAKAMQPLLPLIERLSMYPAETMLAVPGKPDQTVRAVIVLHGIARQLQIDAEALRDEQAKLDAAAQAAQAEAPKLAAAEAAQQQQETALDLQIAAAHADQQQAQEDADAAAARAADEAAKAQTLRTMLTDLEAQRRADEARAREQAALAEHHRKPKEAAADRDQAKALEPAKGAGTIASTAQAAGQLTAPVAGSVFRSWGDPTDAGPAIGISYHAAPSARVVSPCSGRVDFAAPFRSYGELLIVDCGGGYRAVLAGFERLDANVGQRVRQGEPVGVMPNWVPGSGARPSLYVELRHGGTPVNPAPWLRASS